MVTRIDLEIGPDSEEILLTERRLSSVRNKVRAQVSIDGEEVGTVGVRLRGHLGGFQRYTRKPKWKLDFNVYSGERFHGLEALALNNGGQTAFVTERLVHQAFAHLGLRASRLGYAQLFVNGEDYGLQVVLEPQDDRWLKRLERERPSRRWRA